MGRPRNVKPMTMRKILLPAALVGQVETTLFSDAQDRIPYGAWTGLLVPLLEAYLMNIRQIGARDAERPIPSQQGSMSKLAAESDGWHDH